MVARTGKLIVLTLYIGMVLAVPGLASEPGVELGLAREFLKDRDYEAAIFQLKRVIKLYPDTHYSLEAEYLLGISEALRGRFDEALRHLEHVASIPSHPFQEQALIAIGLVLEGQKKLKSAHLHYEILLKELIREEDKKSLIHYRLGWVHLKKGEFLRAKDYFYLVKTPPLLQESSQEITRHIETLGPLPYKSPAVAGALAAVLPGAGHVYVGRVRDALAAFLVNAVFVAATWEAFRNDLEILGSFLGVMELGWYAGNIYSAVNSAHKYNRKLRQDLLDNFQDRLSLDVFLGKGGELGIGLGIRF